MYVYVTLVYEDALITEYFVELKMMRSWYKLGDSGLDCDISLYVNNLNYLIHLDNQG